MTEAVSDEPLGHQVRAVFAASDTADKRCLYAARALEGYQLHHITVAGSNTRIRVVYGTSDDREIERIQPPARFSVAGNVQVHAEQDDPSKEGWAGVAVGIASGSDFGDCRGVETGPLSLQTSVRRVQALDACVVTVEGVAVSLNPGESLEVRGVVSLDSGTAVIFYGV